MAGGEEGVLVGAGLADVHLVEPRVRVGAYGRHVLLDVIAVRHVVGHLLAGDELAGPNAYSQQWRCLPPYGYPSPTTSSDRQS